MSSNSRSLSSNASIACLICRLLAVTRFLLSLTVYGALLHQSRSFQRISTAESPAKLPALSKKTTTARLSLLGATTGLQLRK